MRRHRHSSIHQLLAPSVPRLVLVGAGEARAVELRQQLIARRMVHEVDVVEDGARALALLSGAPDDEPLLKPYVIMLLADMPGAVDFVRALRERDELRDAVIFVLTDSPRTALAEFFSLHIAACIAHDGDWATLLRDYLRVVSLPRPLDYEIARSKRRG